MHKQTYIDVTQLAHWPGQLTGIPRVMNELSTRYANRDGYTFVTWHKTSQKFYVIDLSETLLNRGKSIKFVANPSMPKQASGEAENLLTFIRNKARQIVVRLARKSDSIGFPATRRLFDRINSSRMNQYAAVHPKDGDTLFVLWGEQHDETYISRLIEAKKSGVKLVQISYDMLPLVTPQYSGHSSLSMYNYSKAIFPICDLILSISEHTKKDIIAWLNSMNLKVPRIEFFRLGDDFQLSEPVLPTEKNFVDAKISNNQFILCVGTIEARKNHTLLYYVYKLAAQRNIKIPKIVVVGRRGWLTENIYELINNDPQIRDQFILLENLRDEELSWLYQNCLFSVYPSFYEGWGLPIAESIAYGTPCISSNTSSMPEIAGELIDYFNPASTDECLSAIIKLLEPSNLKKSRQKIAKYKPTLWDETFKQVDNYVRSIK